MAQQVPLAEIVPPPSYVTFPPAVAVVCKIADAVVVVTVGRVARAVNIISFP